MPLIKFVEPCGNEHDIDVPVGSTVMQGAVDNMIDGIPADCGGVCACATCHCYVDEPWMAKAGNIGDTEKEMLEVATGRKENSRLSCQIKVTSAMDGMVVHLPESQW